MELKGIHDKYQSFYELSVMADYDGIDHFIPWSMYPSDTGHNFVLANSSCNSKKSNLLASDEFLHKWQERNEEQDLIIVDQISVLSFLTDNASSHKVAE